MGGRCGDTRGKAAGNSLLLRDISEWLIMPACSPLKYLRKFCHYVYKSGISYQSFGPWATIAERSTCSNTQSRCVLLLMCTHDLGFLLIPCMTVGTPSLCGLVVRYWFQWHYAVQVTWKGIRINFGGHRMEIKLPHTHVRSMWAAARVWWRSASRSLGSTGGWFIVDRI
jgi:hypothetical protein